MTEVVIPLDLSTLDDALSLVDRIGDGTDFYKVGLQLFTAEGPAAVGALRERGKRVFLDLKLHDIPDTVAGAVESAGRAGAELLTVHASGGARMMTAAAEAAEEAGVRLLAVTLLTSAGATDIEEVWGRSISSVSDEVVRLASNAVDAGIDGVVASPLEVSVLRGELGPHVLLVTPGIRLEGDARHDQTRVATPVQAARAGANLLVIGRAVTASPDPAATLSRIRRDLREVQ